MEQHLTLGYWLTLRREVRLKLAQVLDLRPSSSIQVSDNKVISDGYTQADLSGVTLERLQKYLNSVEKDLLTILPLLVKRAEELIDIDNKKASAPSVEAPEAPVEAPVEAPAPEVKPEPVVEAPVEEKPVEVKHKHGKKK